MAKRTETTRSKSPQTASAASGKQADESLHPRKKAKKGNLSKINRDAESQLEELITPVAEAEESLCAIRHGNVDARPAQKPDGDQISTLKGAEQVYRVLVEEMNEGAVMTNADGTVLYCNRALTLILQIAPEKVMGSSLREYLAKESIPHFDRFISQSMRDRAKTEVTLRKASGLTVPVLLSGRILSPDIGVCRVSIIVTDLTVQKRAQEVVRLGRDELEAKFARRTEDLRAHQQELEAQNEELRAAQEELEASRLKYTELYESAPVGYFTLGGNGLIGEVNFAGANLLGVKKDSLINKPFSLFIESNADCAVFLNHCKEAVVKQLPRSCDIRLKRGNGSLFHANLQSVAVHDAGGKLVHIQTAVTDISVRKWAEDALRESEARYRSLVELSPDAVVVHAEEKFAYLNPAALELYGASDAGKIIGRHVLELVPPDDRLSLQSRIREISDRGLKAPLRQMKILRLDGRAVDVESTAVPITYQGKQALQFVIRDITERKRTESALKESDERFRLSLNSVPITVATLDRDLRYTWVYNTRHGFSVEQVMGKRADELLPPRDAAEVIRLQEQVLKSGIGARCEVEGFTRSAKWVYDAAAEPLRNEAGEITGLTWVVLDITERRQAEDALRQHEELLREYVRLLEYAPVLVRNIEGRIILWNSGMQKMYGYSPAEAINREYTNLLKTRFPQPLPDILATVLGKGRWEGELVHTTKKGRDIVVKSLWILHKNSEAKATAVIEINSDITGRRLAEEELRRLNEELESRVRERTHDLARTISTLQSEIDDRINAEEALRESQASLAKAQSVAHIGSWNLDLQTGKLTCSDELFRIFGLDPATRPAPEPVVEQVFHPEDWKKIRSGAQQHMKKLSQAQPQELLVSIADAKRVVWTEAKMVCDEKGKPLSVVGTVQDITDRKHEEEKLIRLVTAVEAAADALVVTDPVKGIIQYVNPAFEKMTGYARDEVVGRDLHFLDSGRHDQAFYRELRENLRTNGFWTGRLVQKRKDGSLYEEECTYSCVKNSAGQIINYISIKRDVTEKARLESIAQAVDTMNNIGYIFSGVSHEIGNPISTIRMILDGMNKNGHALSGKQLKECIDRLIAQVSRVQYLLTTLKNYNMYESLHPQSLHVPSFLESFLGMVRQDFDAKRIVIESFLDHAARTVCADPRALQQVLLNVLTNASDALEGREAPRIRITVLAAGSMVSIQVQDNGIGIDEHRQKELFRPFYTTKEHGTGLGLAIIRKMLSKMHGTVSLSSRMNEGTTVEIMLPAGPDNLQTRVSRAVN